MFISRGVMFVLVMMSMSSVPVAPRARMRVVGAPQQAAPTLHRQATDYQQDLRVNQAWKRRHTVEKQHNQTIVFFKYRRWTKKTIKQHWYKN